MPEQVEMFVAELVSKLRNSAGVPDNVPLDYLVETVCGMISSLKTTIDEMRTSTLNARGDLACILTGEWDETIPWSKLIDRVRELMINTSGATEAVPYSYLPVWADVVHLNNYGMWPGAVIPNWVQERVRRWKCGPTDIRVLMSAANYEIERLQKLVEITNKERDEAIQKFKWGVGSLEDLLQHCSEVKAFLSKVGSVRIEGE